ncbi:MAG TPA: hypothetical protein VIQ29_07630 [Ancylobacter sp.]
MKTRLFVTLSAAAMLVASIAPAALAQDANTLPTPPLGDPGIPNSGPDQPAPQTGELVPLPGPPPEGGAAKIKLPDCAPPNCGVPKIMSD